MYDLLSLLAGILIAIMVSVNGHLTSAYGIFMAAMIIHIIGSLAAFGIRLIHRDHAPLWNHRPLWLYLGGAIGVLTTIFNNAAYGHISLTGIIALELLGQEIMSLVLDTWGLVGMKKQEFHRTFWYELLFSLVGILIMLGDAKETETAAVMFSLGSGLCIVLSRTVNAKLAEQAGALNGALINHLIGLPVTILLVLIAGQGTSFQVVSGVHSWIYLGGVIGVAVVLLFNITVPHLSSFRLTILSFIGQTGAGILLDILSGSAADSVTFSAGLLISCGIMISSLLEHQRKQKEQKEKEYRAHIRQAEEEYRNQMLKSYYENIKDNHTDSARNL